MTTTSTPSPAPEMKRLPAIRCHIGDWWYCVTTLPSSDVASRIKRAKEFLQPKGFDEMVQREVQGRYKQVAGYLLEEQQRFFSAIVVGVRGGEPRFFALDVEPNPLVGIPELDRRFEESLGILELRGDEQLFAIDGQHRVEGIKLALKKNPALKDDELTIIFVAAQSDPASVQWVRRVFPRLNRYAVPTKKGEIIAIDEDDPSAIITRRMLAEHEGFYSPDGAMFGEKDHFI
ncbi:MAG: DGQHR domain-containing protein [SAR202 cluster bacterium]|nr:DGQHR domain-containing protein [SAR202 cluster bacterium]